MRILLFLLAGLLAWAAPNDKQAEVLLQAAMKLEMVDGNLEAAIQKYKKIIASHPDSRAVAAKALVQMGQCYERLASPEARSAYERVVREYAEQAEPAQTARARLAALTPAVGIATRQVWASGSSYDAGSVSADGRYMSFIDWTTGDVAVRDLRAGENRHVTNKGPWTQSEEMGFFPRISPDGKFVAYTWMDQYYNFVLRVIGLDGSGARDLHRSPETMFLIPGGWSPDSRQVVVSLTRRDQTKQIAVVNVPIGALRVLKTGDWRQPENSMAALVTATRPVMQ